MKSNRRLLTLLVPLVFFASSPLQAKEIYLSCKEASGTETKENGLLTFSERLVNMDKLEGSPIRDLSTIQVSFDLGDRSGHIFGESADLKIEPYLISLERVVLGWGRNQRGKVIEIRINRQNLAFTYLALDKSVAEASGKESIPYSKFRYSKGVCKKMPTSGNLI